MKSKKCPYCNKPARKNGHDVSMMVTRNFVSGKIVEVTYYHTHCFRNHVNKLGMIIEIKQSIARALN